MSLLKVNNALLANASKDFWRASNYHIMSFFSGTMPTEAEMKALLKAKRHANGYLLGSTLVPGITALGPKHLIAMDYALNSSYVNNNIDDLNETKRFSTITTKHYPNANVDDTATWFMLARCSYNQLNSGSCYVYSIVVGTIGDGASEADLKLSDTHIVTGKVYRLNDITLNCPIAWAP